MKIPPQIVLCVTAVALSLSVDATARAASLSAAGPIQLQVAKGKCLDVRSSGTADGTIVQLYDCNGTNAQQWTYTGGTVQALGKCLDVNGNANANGTKVQLWTCNGTGAQQWAAKGSTIVWSNNNKCLDLPSGNQNDWTQLQVWDCAGNNNQLWASTVFGGATTNPNTTQPTDPTTPTTPGNKPSPVNNAPVAFGPNVLIFDASSNVQAQADAVFAKQETNQFGNDRYALLFKPGAYTANVQVGFYTTVHGLGTTPDAVTITGGVTATAAWQQGNATQNFWRGMENLAIAPTKYSNSEMWAVSQATEIRRVHVKGVLQYYDFLYYPGGVNWSSGGFMADSLVDQQVVPGSQQQFLTRNSDLTLWSGGVWNMVFVGSKQAPSGAWPSAPFTTVDTTPVIREKPYLTIDGSGNYSVMVPKLKKNSQGISWGSTPDSVTQLNINSFYIAHAGTDTAATLNAALQSGYNILFTPGIYHLSSSLQVNWHDTVLLGIGKATLTPDNGTAALTVADVDGVTVAGLILDAGPKESSTLLLAGTAKTSVDHSANPTVLFDLSCRVGGAAAATAASCFTINVNNLILDNVWLWRADHGAGVGWDVNVAQNGLITNGDNVTAYGLFVEHFENYQTLWNGNGGATYFYQSEIPYDVPSQSRWTHDGQNGYASYKVADSVTSHTAKGLGIYCNFYNNVDLDTAIQTPANAGVQFNHIVTMWLGVDTGSSIKSIINGTGGAVTSASGQAKTSY